MPCTTMIPSPAAIVNSSLGREPLFSQYRRKKVTRPGLQQGLALLLHGLMRRPLIFPAA